MSNRILTLPTDTNDITEIVLSTHCGSQQMVTSGLSKTRKMLQIAIDENFVVLTSENAAILAKTILENFPQ